MTRSCIIKLSCFAAFILSLILSLNYGSSDLTLLRLVNAVSSSFDADASEVKIFLNLRLPRVIVAVLCGASLSAAGVLSQGLFRNALASPSIIGTTAGGAAFASAAYVLGATSLGYWVFPVSAFAGCFLATIIIIVIAYKAGDLGLENLLLCGLAISSLFSAVTSLSLSLALEEYQRLPVMMHWLLGSIESKEWGELICASIAILLTLILTSRLTRTLDVLVLGEDVAQTLSVDIRRLQLKIIAAIALLEALSLALAGAITFVGLIVPHITRKMLGPQHRPLFFYSALNGATLLLLSDLIARTARAPAEIQVGVVVATLGAAFFLYLIVCRAKQFEAGL